MNVSVHVGHNLVSVMDEEGDYHKVCTCEITGDDINGDGTLSFPLGEQCSRRSECKYCSVDVSDDTTRSNDYLLVSHYIHDCTEIPEKKREHYNKPWVR